MVNGLLAAAISATDDLLGKSASFLKDKSPGQDSTAKPKPPEAPETQPQRNSSIEPSQSCEAQQAPPGSNIMNESVDPPVQTMEDPCLTQQASNSSYNRTDLPTSECSWLVPADSLGEPDQVPDASAGIQEATTIDGVLASAEYQHLDTQDIASAGLSQDAASTAAERHAITKPGEARANDMVFTAQHPWQELKRSSPRKKSASVRIQYMQSLPPHRRNRANHARRRQNLHVGGKRPRPPCEVPLQPVIVLPVETLMSLNKETIPGSSSHPKHHAHLNSQELLAQDAFPEPHADHMGYQLPMEHADQHYENETGGFSVAEGFERYAQV